LPAIIGGLGPFAHVWFEQRLLQRAGEQYGASADSDFPPWVLISTPQTPDRSAALLHPHDAPSPADCLLGSLQMAADAGADFAVIACNTIHHWLAEIADRVPLPVLHVGTVTADYFRRHLGAVRLVGLLATDGTVRSRIFERALGELGVELLTPTAGNQAELVTAAIYGDPVAGGARAGGIKAGQVTEGARGNPSPRQRLTRAAHLLVERRQAEAILIACSEISLAILPEEMPAPVIDTMDVLAAATLAVAAGDRDLPE
jgi:aspartate racemase